MIVRGCSWKETPMRTSRIVEEGAAYYHIMSRVVDRRRVFDDGEKDLAHGEKALGKDAGSPPSAGKPTLQGGNAL
jgi:hypothetical protein